MVDSTAINQHPPADQTPVVLAESAVPPSQSHNQSAGVVKNVGPASKKRKVSSSYCNKLNSLRWADEVEEDNDANLSIEPPSSLDKLAETLSADIEKSIKSKVDVAWVDTYLALEEAQNTVKNLRIELKEANETISARMLDHHDMQDTITDLEIQNFELEKKNEALQGHVGQMQRELNLIHDENAHMRAHKKQNKWAKDIASFGKKLAGYSGRKGWRNWLGMVDSLHAMILAAEEDGCVF